MMDDKVHELLTCRLHGQALGLPVRYVQEVITPLRCTAVPLAHDIISGLINLRGHVITQLDMRKALRLPDREDHDAFRVVIIETAEGETFGLAVDEVGEVMRSRPETFEKTPLSLPPCWQAVGSGVLKLRDELLVVLDIERFVRATLDIAGENGRRPGEVETRETAREADE